MHIPFAAAPLLLALLTSQPQAPAPVTATPAPARTCWYEPSGTVFIGIGEVQTFFSDSGLDTCSGLSVSISPANGVAGFSSGTACTKTSVTTGTAGIFKVRGCEAGSVTVTVSSGGRVLQTIYVSVGAPV